MNIIVIGAGEVGIHIARFLSEARHNVVVIDADPVKVADLEEQLDVQTLCAHGTDIAVLEQAGVKKADLVLAVSNSDEVNFTSAHLAKRLGARRTIVRARKMFYLDEHLSLYAGAFDVDRIICPEVLTAMELARLVENPGALEVKFFARGRIQMRRLVAEAGAPGTGRQLKDLAFPKAALVASLTRDEQMIVPSGDDEIRPGDLVTVIGATGEIGKIHELFHTSPEKIRRVVIAGAGLVGYSLARILGQRRFEVRLVDRDRARCEQVAAELKRTEVLSGDVTYRHFIEETRLSNTDAYIAVTNNDETNLMSALLMRQFGVEETAVLVHRPDFTPLLKQAGVAHALSARYVMASAVTTALQRRDVAAVELLDEGQAEILEVRIPSGAAIIGRSLREAGLPRGCILAAIVRRGEVHVPRGDSALMMHDTVVAYALASVAGKVEDVLTRPE